MSKTAIALAYCDYVRHTVIMKNLSYIEDLLSICVEDYINLLIPTIDTDLFKLSEN